MKYAGRTLAGLYAAIVLVAALYALTTEIHLRHQEVEHLLPSAVLAFVTLPLSLTIGPLDSLAPTFFDAALVQIAFLALCGAVQAAVLWWLASPQRARSAH